MIDKAFKKSAKVAKKAAKGVAAKVANRSSRVKKKIAAASPKGADKGDRSATTKSGVALASKLIDNRRKVLGDWRGTILQKVREIIREADPEIGEEWKWETPIIRSLGRVKKTAIEWRFFQIFPEMPIICWDARTGSRRRDLQISHEVQMVTHNTEQSMLRSRLLLEA